MAVKCTNWREVELEFARAKEEYDRKAVEWLSALGERVVKYAREHGKPTQLHRVCCGTIRKNHC